jgi:hypothetical protein
LSVFVLSSMISFSCSDISWADELIFQRLWSSSECSVFHREATIWTNTCGWSIINCILWIRTYINTGIILLPTILLSLLLSLTSTPFRTFQSLGIMSSICSCLVLTRLAGIPLLA